MNRSELGIELSNWSKSLGQHWSDVRFGTITSRKEGTNYIFEVQVFFGELCPNAASVELYAEASTDGDTFRRKMNVARRRDAPDNHILYSRHSPGEPPGKRLHAARYPMRT